MIAEEIAKLQSAAVQRIERAETPEQLEAVRVEVLGRKGTLGSFSKEMAKLTPDERAVVGKVLNAAKQTLESSLEARKVAFDAAALQNRLQSEWVDLTLPAPGVRRGS